MTAVVVALAFAVLLLAVLVAGLLRSHAEILRALHELGAGLELDRAAGPAGPEVGDGVVRPRRARRTGVPEVLSGTTLDDETLLLSLRGTGVLLAFLSSGCTTCQEFWTAFAGEVPDVPGGARLVVVGKDLDTESASALAARRPRTVPLVLSSAAWEAFDVPGSPYFVLVDDGRVVGEGTGTSWAQVADLLGQARADAGSRRRPRRQERDEQALREAGIGPDHPSLRVPPPRDEPVDAR